MTYLLLDPKKRADDNLAIWQPILTEALARSVRRTPEFRRASTGWKLDRRVRDRRAA